jgi:hypothetical protein
MIKYESLLNENEFINIMYKIKNYGLQVNPAILFPQNILVDAKNKNKIYEKNTNEQNKNKNKKISNELILNHPYFNTYYERKLGYL